MTTTTLKNLYWRRQVAEASAKACWICYRPSSCVLTTPDNSDWFYICPGHLKDVKFATAKDADDLEQKRKDAEIEAEIEAVKKEYAEKMKKKMDRKWMKEGEKYGKDPEKEKKKDEEEESKLEEEKAEKLKELEKKKKEKEPDKTKIEGPRIFELQKSFWQMRQQKKAQAANAKRNQERMRSADFFPSVPQGP